ncbi:MAG TPA: PQQ-dependent sugar dehydrogenase [Bryobacteraceae bacterium]|nr:PQQ-dependent sugar dehydrogenase [Bryobacteraceae bacterium]
MSGLLQRSGRAAAIIALVLAFVPGCSFSTGAAPAPNNTGKLARTGTIPAAQTNVAPLIVDDAAATNPNLVSVGIASAAGLPSLPNSVNLPPGFSISLIASGMTQPRFMAFDPSGNLIVGTDDGVIYRLPRNGGSVTPTSAPATLLTGLHAPHSLGFSGGYLYVAETDRVRRFPYAADGTLGSPETVIGDLPLVGEHFSRTVIFGADGKMYVSAGSSCNICVEQDPRRAAISQYNTDGSGWVRFAWGARNAVGLAIQPGTNLLWATVNERDDQGNEIPPDLVTAVHQGDDFGWPYCLPPNATPQDPGDNCTGITPPTIGIQAHSAPLGLAFYTGSQFPSDYQGDLFVVQHGSWDRMPPAPPQIVRIHFVNGQPAGVQDFATGWQTDDKPTRWGRPAGIIVAPDGSLIVSDDQSGYIYRISYGGS